MGVGWSDLERARDAIGPEAAEAVAERLASSPAPQVWRQLLDRLGLLGGVGLLIAGVVYIVAFNWSGLGRFSQLSIGVMPFLLAVLVGAWRADPVGQVGFAAAAFLVGPILVIYSQIYQTGADGWLLFAAWTALALPWALLSRTAGIGLWMFLLVQASVGLFLTQTQGLDHPEGQALVSASITALWWALWELRNPPRPYLWLLASGFFVITVTLTGAALWEAVGGTGVVLLALGVVLSQVVYNTLRRDLVLVALSATAVVVTLGVVGVRALVALDVDVLGGSFLMTFWWTALAVVLAVVLRLAMVLHAAQDADA